MLLIDPEYAAKSLDVSCGTGREAVSAAANLIIPITNMLPRVEDALDLASLSRIRLVDRFRVCGRGAAGYHRLRLANGFVTTSSLVGTYTNTGDLLLPVDTELDAHYGILTVPANYTGIISVVYDSGFLPKAVVDVDGQPIPPELQVLDVPQWLQTIAIHVLNEWLRSAPRNLYIKDGVSLSAMNAQSNRALHTAIWGRYMRPRSDVIWTSSSEQPYVI